MDNNFTLNNVEKEFEKICEATGEENWIQKFRNHEIPEDAHIGTRSGRYKSIMYNIGSLYLRKIAIELCGFTFITKKYINALTEEIMAYTNKKPEDTTIMDLGCGLGTLTFALRKKGFSVIPIDNYDRMKTGGTFNIDNLWIDDIENRDIVEATREYVSKCDFIILTWPEMSNDACMVLEEMRNNNPNCKMIYIGESWEGCNADDEFFEKIRVMKKEDGEKYFEKANIEYCQWDGIHDFTYLIE